MTFKARLSVCAALIALSPVAPAFAQHGESQITDVITVTTQKREQSVTDVPINLTAYNTRRLEVLGIEQFDELSDFVPGLEIQEQSPNTPGFAIRGITSDDTTATGEARVAVFQDGVPISRARGAFVELHDVERVEVAKGPQPTLFGRGALIGGINIIQNKAQLDDAMSGAASFTLGDYNRVEARAHVNLPLGETVALRLAAAHKARDGYVDNVLGGPAMNAVDLVAYRVSARWEPTDALRLDVIANYQDDTPEGGTSFKSGVYAPAPGVSLEPWDPAALNTLPVLEDGAPLGIGRKVYGVTVLGDYILNDDWSISSITGWRALETREILDSDGFAAELLAVGENGSGHQWSQEIRFNYDAGGPLTGFFGVSYFYERSQQRIALASHEAAVQALLAPQLAAGAGLTVAQVEALLALQGVPNAGGFDDPLNPLGLSVPSLLTTGQIAPLSYYREGTTNFGETTAFDVFADLSYAVTDRLTLSAGLRWTHEDKEAGISGWHYDAPNRVTGAPTVFLPATPNGVMLESGERSFDDYTWRLTGQYDLNAAVNLFASYARGRRPDVISFSDGQFVIAPAEIVDSYEVGGYWTLDSTNIQASVFYSEYDNFQSGRLEPQSATYIVDNAGSATQYGFEGQVDHQMTDGLSVFATYAYNISEFDDTDSGGNLQEFAGNTFRLSPDHAVSVGVLAEFDASFGRLSLIPTWTWQSEVFFNNDNDLTDAVQDEVQGDFGLINVRARLDLPNERVYGEVFVNNLADEAYIIDAGNTGDSFGIPTFIAGSPRMAGVRVGASF
ncbi:TonB-dependent receptor [Oceanicaulis sp.]|uniref:TonB-dependent receptor n=1 Tax=Oceanicaulis sp. TaxID=1924941 RepID=UPI003D273199